MLDFIHLIRMILPFEDFGLSDPQHTQFSCLLNLAHIMKEQGGKLASTSKQQWFSLFTDKKHPYIWIVHMPVTTGWLVSSHQSTETSDGVPSCNFDS